MQKRVFKITIVNNQISLQEKIDNEFIPLRKEGEESFEFDNSFWEWFKQKIEYDGELLEFVLNCDREIEFDSSLNISRVEYSNRVEYRSKSSNISHNIKNEHTKIVKKQTPLAKFFIDKVKEYKER